MNISVIVPVLNEEKTIHLTLQALHKQPFPGDMEIIVVDGGSQDETVALASAYARVIQSKPGRARQMNAGAKIAAGDILLFLHSDSILEDGALSEMLKHMKSERKVAGCFRLVFSGNTWPLRLIAWGSDLRARLFKIMFGDQGIFVQRDVFQKMGGFPDIELMEDWEFSRKLKSVGDITVLRPRIYTSSRRFEQNGVWKTLFHMHRLKWLYVTGTPPSELKRAYADIRQK